MDENNGFIMGRVAAGVRLDDGNANLDLRLKTESGRQIHKAAHDQSFFTIGPEMTASFRPFGRTMLTTAANFERRY